MDNSERITRSKSQIPNPLDFKSTRDETPHSLKNVSNKKSLSTSNSARNDNDICTQTTFESCDVNTQTETTKCYNKATQTSPDDTASELQHPPDDTASEPQHPPDDMASEPHHPPDDVRVPKNGITTGLLKQILALFLTLALVPVVLVVNNGGDIGSVVQLARTAVDVSIERLVSTSLWDEAKNLLDTGMTTLNQEFPDMNEDKWLRLSSSARWVISKEEPRHPASIVVLLQNGPENLAKSSTMMQLMEKYGGLVNNVFAKILNKKPQPVFQIDQAYFSAIGGRITILHQDMAKYFKQGGRSIIVRDVDKITNNDELMVFHTLCDDFSAPEKRALVIFLVNAPESIIQWDEEKSNDIAYKTLDKLWSPVMSANYRGALLARVLRESILS